MSDTTNKTMCTVEMDGTTIKSEDFVAVLTKEDGTPTITYNTDALTLGMAFRLLAVSYVECLNKCTPEEREQIKTILEESYPVQAPEVPKAKEVLTHE